MPVLAIPETDIEGSQTGSTQVCEPLFISSLPTDSFPFTNDASEIKPLKLG